MVEINNTNKGVKMETIFFGNPQTALSNIATRHRAEKAGRNKRLEPRYYSDREISAMFNPTKESNPEIKAVNYALKNFARKISQGGIWEDDCFQVGILYYIRQRQIGYSSSACIGFSMQAMIRAFFREFLTSVGKNTVSALAEQEQEFALDIFPPVPDRAGTELDYQAAFVTLLSRLRNSRQADILSLFAVGYGLKEISGLLDIEYYTVRRELVNIRNLVKR